MGTCISGKKSSHSFDFIATSKIVIAELHYVGAATILLEVEQSPYFRNVQRTISTIQTCCLATSNKRHVHVPLEKSLPIIVVTAHAFILQVQCHCVFNHRPLHHEHNMYMYINYTHLCNMHIYAMYTYLSS